MEMKKGELFEHYLKANGIIEDTLGSLELKYIKLLCPIIEQKMDEAYAYYSQYKLCKIDMSSLAKELGVSRPTIYKKGILAFVEYCQKIFPGSYHSREVKRLSQQVQEKEERLQEFRMKDYDIEELRFRCMSADKTINDNNISIKNLEKRISQLEKENDSLRQHLGQVKESTTARHDNQKTHIEREIVNGHLK